MSKENPPTYEESQNLHNSFVESSDDTSVASSPLTQDLPRNIGPNRTLSRRAPPNRPQQSDESTIGKGDNQRFWKFHMQVFANDIYLSTNPTMRHLHCRSAPGYFISVERDSPTSKEFTMNFEDFETGVSLLRVGKQESGEFKYKVRRTRELRDGVIQEVAEPREVYGGVLRSRRIEPMFYPIPPLYAMRNFNTDPIDGKIWNIGDIPRCRMKWSLSKRKEVLQYIGKQNTYFHDNIEQKRVSDSSEVPPVKAVFRVCESRAKKRAIRSLNRLLRIDMDRGETSQEPDPYEEVKYYPKCGDGLYDDIYPRDDEPDHHIKLGWLTIYDDDLLRTPGMFDLIVGLTAASAYDKLMSL